MKRFTITPEGNVHNVHYTDVQARHYARNLEKATIAVEQPKIQTVTRQFVCLALVVEVLKAKYPETKFEVDFGNNVLEIYYKRYTMNPVGFHIGWENYTFAIPLHRKYPEELNTMIVEAYGEEAEWLCEFGCANATCDDAPESELCGCESGDCDCNAENLSDHCCAEECQCELYINPFDDDMLMDFIEDEMAYMLEDITETDAEWRFNGKQWTVCIDDKAVWLADEGSNG